MTVSAIMPVYNEESTLEKVAETTLNYVDELVIIDDGSTDKTGDILKKIKRKYYGKVKVACTSRNMGKGYAVSVGLKLAKGQIVIVQDSDGEYPPEQIPNIVRPVLKGAEVCFGSRFIGSWNGMHVTHYIGNMILSMVTSIFTVRKVTDVMTGAKCWRRDINKSGFRSRAFTIETEIAMKLLMRDKKFVEVPFFYKRRSKGVAKLKWPDFFKCLLSIPFYRLLSTVDKSSK